MKYLEGQPQLGSGCRLSMTRSLTGREVWEGLKNPRERMMEVIQLDPRDPHRRLHVPVRLLMFHGQNGQEAGHFRDDQGCAHESPREAGENLTMGLLRMT